ncbi:hypothetical protein RKD37_000396 [Streptomyces ambofaciens]
MQHPGVVLLIAAVPGVHRRGSRSRRGIGRMGA